MVSSFISSLTVGLGLYVLSRVIIRFTHDEREPPIRDDTFPVLSLVFNMARKGGKYWASQIASPIYTLRLPGLRCYVINATSLIPIMQRQVDTISFAPILIHVASTVMALSRNGFDIISKDPLENRGFISKTYNVNHSALNPGPNLDMLNKKLWQLIVKSLGDAAATTKGVKAIRLQQWTANAVTMAISESIYGSGNPFRDPANVASWFEFKSGMLQMMINILPGITARKSRLARESLVNAFVQYYKTGISSDSDASTFIQSRHALFTQQGLSMSDIARIEVTTSFALLSNAITGTFWLIFHIFSDPSLLEECRNEISKAIKQEGCASTIDLEFIMKSCPTLSATFKEVLRVHTHGVSVRKVVEDDLLDNQYLLKKGGLVLVPSRVQHNLTQIWGDDTGRFDHRRFLGLTDIPKTNRSNPAADRSFGGGRSLCPGRHFAATEIMAFAAVFILRFDVRPVGGQWVTPTVQNSDATISIDQPDHDIDVEICSRNRDPWVAISP